MVAVGHVARESMVPLYMRTIAPGPVIHVGAAVPAAVSLDKLRTRLRTRPPLMSRQVYGPESSSSMWSRTLSPALPVAKKLRSPAPRVHPRDAPWAWRGTDRGP